MDGTHVLQSSKGRDCDGPSLRQNGEAVSEPAVNPFLRQNRQNTFENVQFMFRRQKLLTLKSIVSVIILLLRQRLPNDQK